MICCLGYLSVCLIVLTWLERNSVIKTKTKKNSDRAKLSLFIVALGSHLKTTIKEKKELNKNLQNFKIFF